MSTSISANTSSLSTAAFQRRAVEQAKSVSSPTTRAADAAATPTAPEAEPARQGATAADVQGSRARALGDERALVGRMFGLEAESSPVGPRRGLGDELARGTKRPRPRPTGSTSTVQDSRAPEGLIA
jgi:hypothetical protein